ncbi:hypothetical protein [Sphingomonas soli]|uniref:hypothetical protein n=1 Tax=Sphingomonas soli TaxID=266127 RepID=UPI00083131F1|nr:hypothetical protein [Sphingomonas soli]
MILLLGLLAQMPPQTVLTIPAGYRLIEGVASDGETIWVSSILDRVIVEHRNGKFRTMPMPDGAGAPLAISYDTRRGWIWIASHCPRPLKVAGCTGAWLVAMDRKGKVRRRLRPANDAVFTPGDVSVWRDQVFVSDSANGAVYRCKTTCQSLTPLIAPRQKGSAQGSAVYDEGRKLLVADYGLRLISVDLATGVETPVLMADGNRLRGVDGLVADGDGFVAVRNPNVPGKAWRFRISADNKVVDPGVAAEGGAIVDPTQIARAGKRLLIVGDAQWSAHLPDKDGKVSGVQKPTPIIAIPAR